jgi:hypothetical protein
MPERRGKIADASCATLDGDGADEERALTASIYLVPKPGEGNLLNFPAVLRVAVDLRASNALADRCKNAHDRCFCAN